MNRKRRRQIVEIESDLQIIARKIRILHDDEYHYREALWHKGLDESDTADTSDDALDALNSADTTISRALAELTRARR